MNTSPLTHTTVPIGTLKHHPRNPRKGDVEAIKRSLVHNGMYKALVVNRRTMEVLVVNHTLKAAREVGLEEVDVTLLDVDEDKARRIMLADNRTADLAGYDDELLAEVLAETPDLAGTGYGPEDLETLLADVGDPGPDEDDPPPIPAEPRTRIGDIYALGRHRLVCGDAGDAEVYVRLLQCEQPELVFTDPPYGVDYEGKTSERLTLQGDSEVGLSELLAHSFARVDSVLAPGARVYVCHPAGPLSLTFGGAFVERWRLKQTLVWLKDQMVLGRSDYHYKHEPILYGYKPGRAPIGRGGRGWFAGNAEVSVLEVRAPRPRATPRR